MATGEDKELGIGVDKDMSNIEFDEMIMEKSLTEKNIAVDKKQIRNKERLLKLSEVMEEMAKNKFTGYIRVNYSQGIVSRIEKFEEILKK
ncbi:hypothetical protein [Desulfobacterium sp. N47]|uniref:Uncharacterized protein n=1 Tax=uncultured Desulfobacterium sp. TaxID=201089 RepID=E1YK42_9BACT|nr:unknown protein [uncultured Desulfobacterium sp.]